MGPTKLLSKFKTKNWADPKLSEHSLLVFLFFAGFIECERQINFNFTKKN